MNNPDILLHKKHQIAFEEMINQEANKFLTKTNGQKILDKLKQYGILVGVPNVIAGALGYVTGGLEGSLEAMKQVSISVLPYNLIFQGFNDLIQQKYPIDNIFIQYKHPVENINYAIEKTRGSLIPLLNITENKPGAARILRTQTAISAAACYGLSLLTEKITGIDFNQALMAVTGAGIGFFNSGMAVYVGNKWINRIEDYAETHVEEIEEKKGTILRLEDLECLLRGALGNPDQTEKIYVASSEKRFRGIGGARGFFGALDELADKDRDSTRVKPNVTMNLRSGDIGYNQKSSQFTFEYKREKSQTDAILDIARIAKVNSNDVQLEIHPMFRNVPLDEMLSSPYEHLSTVFIQGKKDGAEYFKIKYNFNDDADKVDITINSRRHLDIVLDLFESLYGRHIEDLDFDSELIGLSEKRLSDKQSAETKNKTQIISENLSQELHDLNIDASQFGIFDQKDALDSLRPKKDKEYPRFRNDDKKSLPKQPEQPEQPISNLDSLSKLVLATYKANKDKILPTLGPPSLGIAFEGAAYSLTPMIYNKKGKKARTAFHVAGNPIGTIKSLVTDGEVLPSLKVAEVMAQISGISRKNVYEVVRELETKIKGLSVKPNLISIDYKTFWEIPNNPQIFADKAYNIEVSDRKGAVIQLYFKEMQQSYKTIREEYFPSGKALEAKAEESRQARENRDFSKDVFAMFGKSRSEKELEKPTYQVVSADGKVPNHVIMYEYEDIEHFMQNSTVQISTNESTFIYRPVHPKEGIQKITNYLSQLREAVDIVNSQ